MSFKSIPPLDNPLVTEPYSKKEQMLDPKSDWNQAPMGEPVFVLRALNWKAALVVIGLIAKDDGNRTVEDLPETALAMRDYNIENDIPF